MDTIATKVTVVQPGSGQSVSIPGFGAIYKIYSRDNGGEVAMVVAARYGLNPPTR